VGLSAKRFGKKDNRFSSYIKSAIGFYKQAIDLDSNYPLSISNLGAAYLINNEPYKSIALLKDAGQRWPNNVYIKNALGVAFFAIDKVDLANSTLLEATRLSPQFSSPLYNLGKVAHLGGHDDKAKLYWSSYLNLDSMSYWALLIRNKYGVGEKFVTKRGLPTFDFESVSGVHVADFKNEIPGTWRNKTSYIIANTDNSILRFNNGVDAVLESDAIRLIQVSNKFVGVSKRGIKIGDGVGSLQMAYGNPAMHIETTFGNSWVYPANGISFQVKNSKVVSWLVY
jgi:tetratricopeptide (TPR) repeat protein